MKKYFLFSVFVEFALLNFMLLLLFVIKFGITAEFNDRYRVMVLFIYVGFFVDMYSLRRRNDSRINGVFGTRFMTEVSSMLLMFGVISFLIYITKISFFSRFLVFGTIGGFFILRLAFGQVYVELLKHWRSKKLFQRRILIVGAGPTAQKAFEYINNNLLLGYVVEGLVDDGQETDLENVPLLGSISDLDYILHQYPVEEVFITIPITRQDEIVNIISVVDRFGIRVRLVADLFYLMPTVVNVEEMGEVMLFKIRNYDLDVTLNAFVKRTFDLVFSGVILLLLMPLFAVIALAIKLDSPGPVFYCPMRIGAHGRQFRMYKFRSMIYDLSSNETLSTAKSDPRITRVGRFIRRTSIDELPQFFNVLLGDMSIVGPRPHRVWLNEEMKRNVKDYMLRSYFKPGITGWAQVNGYRGTMSTMEHRLQRTKYDLWYFENWSFLFDLRIIVLTVFGINANKDVY